MATYKDEKSELENHFLTTVNLILMKVLYCDAEKNPASLLHLFGMGESLRSV